MTELLASAGTLAFRKALEVLNKKLANGDVTEQQFRRLLITDVDEIKESLTALRHKEFQAAALQLSNAFDLYTAGKGAEAEFIKARSNAEMALGALKCLPDKIEAVRMAALAAVYQHEGDKSTAMSLCLGYLRHLLAMPEVQATFKVRRATNLSSRVKRTFKKAVRDMNDVVYELHAFAWDMACFMQEEGQGVRWPCLMVGRYFMHPLIPPDNDDPCSGKMNGSGTAPRYRYETSEKRGAIRVYNPDTDRLVRQIHTEAHAHVTVTSGYAVSFKLEKKREKTAEKGKVGKGKEKNRVTVIQYAEVRSEDGLGLVATLDFSPDVAVCGEISAAARGDKVAVAVGALIGLWDVGRGARGKCHWVINLPSDAGEVAGVSWCCERHVDVSLSNSDVPLTFWAE